MRERIDFSSDIAYLIAQLKRLAAARLGRKLKLGPLVFVDAELAQVIIDIDSAVRLYGDKELKEDWKALRRRVIRKLAVIGIKELSESSRLFIASGGESAKTEEEE